MTQFEDTESSAHDGAPVEGYKFTGSLQNYFYTSADQEETIGGNVFTPLEIKRSAVRSGTQDDDSLDLELELPASTLIVADYGYSISPPNLVLEVFRYHRGDDPAIDFAVIWKGPVASFSITNQVAKIQIPSIFTVALKGEIPSVYFHNPCNHILFDVRCKLVRASYKQDTTIASITDETNIVVADDGFDDNYLRAGEFVNVTTGERRLIIDNVANLITVNFPFHSIAVGQTVELASGCDHIFSTCISKYSNGVNYGGFPYVPGDNPFRFEL